MPFEMPVNPKTARRDRISGFLTFLVAAMLVVLVTYLGYVGYEGSRQLAGHLNPSTACRTPATMGWDYEAINYDATVDATLAAEADPQNCTARGAPAGSAVATPDGVALAGWYIPAASGIGPAGPTVVLAHGWGHNKSHMLDHAAVLHEQYNVVAFDFRNHGQSGGEQTTQGALEQADLRTVIDWLMATKAPAQVAVLGVSMGGATAVNEVADDQRVGALILDSTHATLAGAIQARLELEGYPLSVPGSWAILLGGLIRTGQDVSAADPIGAVPRLGTRPLLILSGGLDDEIGPNDSADLADAASAAGVNVLVGVCEEARHASGLDACPAEYREWVLGFLVQAFGGP